MINKRQLAHKPSNKECGANFDKIASFYDEITSGYAVSRRRDILVSWAYGDCLDVGAGTGEIANGLVTKCRVVAIDISPRMVEEIRKKLNIETRVCDAEKLPFDDNSFDTVVAAECIYYLNNCKRFIAEAYRVLRPGGHLLISSATNIAMIYEHLRTILRLLGFRKMYFDDKNRNFMNIKKLEKLLGNGGFKIDKIRKVIVIPFGPLDYVNRLLERSLFKHFALFILAYARRP